VIRSSPSPSGGRSTKIGISAPSGSTTSHATSTGSGPKLAIRSVTCPPSMPSPYTALMTATLRGGFPFTGRGITALPASTRRLSSPVASATIRGPASSENTNTSPTSPPRRSRASSNAARRFEVPPPGCTSSRAAITRSWSVVREGARRSASFPNTTAPTRVPAGSSRTSWIAPLRARANSVVPSSDRDIDMDRSTITTTRPLPPNSGTPPV